MAVLAGDRPGRAGLVRAPRTTPRLAKCPPLPVPWPAGARGGGGLAGGRAVLAGMWARRRGAAEVVVAERQEDLRAACERRQWPCELLPNGHVKVEHKAESLNPLLRLLDDLKLAPLEIVPSPNALEETFVQALELSHAAA